MARREDQGNNPNREASGPFERDVATPPYTAPAWIDIDADEFLGPISAGDSSDEGRSGEDLLAFCVELAMKNRQHHRIRSKLEEDAAPVYRFGSEDTTLYAIEDGLDRLMIGRGVGRDSEGCVYCLVGAASPVLLSVLDAGEVEPTDAFDDAAELTLCSVFDSGQISNVVLVQHYKRIQDVPVEYRPGQPFLQFSDG